MSHGSLENGKGVVRSPLSWYVVYSNPSAEWAVCQRLRPLETLFLHYRDTTRHARRTREVIRPYFPRYVFVAVPEDQGLYGIANTIGVHSIVGVDGPEEIPEAVIAELRGRGDASGLCVLSPEEKKLRKRLQHGARVSYTPDPFTEWFGEVMLDSGSAISAWINGRKVVAPHHHFSPARAAR